MGPEIGIAGIRQYSRTRGLRDIVEINNIKVALFLRVVEAKTSGSGLSSSDEIDKSEMPDAKEEWFRLRKRSVAITGEVNLSSLWSPGRVSSMVVVLFASVFAFQLFVFGRGDRAETES